MADQPEPGGAVVVAPREPGRRPRPVDEPLVGVHRGGEQHHQLGHPAQAATEEPAQLLRAAQPGRPRGPRRRRRRCWPSRHRLRCTWQLDPAWSACGLAMNVTLTPWRSAVSLRHCLNTDVAVGRLEDVGVAHVHLVLAEAPLALRALHRHARARRGGGGRRRGSPRCGRPAGAGSPRGTSRPARARRARRGRRPGSACGRGSARARWRPSP